MATAQALIDDVRSRIVEATASYFTDAELLRWLNQGYKRFLSLTEWSERIVAYPIIANQFEYTLASDTIKVADVRWQDKYKVWFRDREEFGRYAGQSAGQTSARPYMYSLFPWDSKIRLYPKQSTASVCTTATDCAISSSITTLGCVSTTGFPTYGRFKVDSEQILYYNTSATSFLQCVRGDGGTTATTHAFGASMCYAPLEVYQCYQPADMVVGTIGSITSPTYDEALINYACHIAMLKRERYTESQLFRKLFDDIVGTAVAERRRMQLDRQFVIKDEDDYGSYYSWV